MQAFTPSNTAFSVVSSVVVVGIDPEYADYDNPRGERYGFAAYVRGCNDRGDTCELHVATDRDEGIALAKASKMADALNVRAKSLGKLPVGFGSWATGRPVYGSDAYVECGQADDVALEARELADEGWR